MSRIINLLLALCLAIKLGRAFQYQALNFSNLDASQVFFDHTILNSDSLIHCAAVCKAKSNSQNCSVFAMQGSTCFLGALNASNGGGSVIPDPGTQIMVNQNILTSMMAGFKDFLVLSSNVWSLFTFTVGFTYPTVDECLIKCIMSNNCTMFVYENETCHLGTNLSENGANDTILSDPTGPWNIYALPSFVNHITYENVPTASHEALNVSGLGWSPFIFSTVKGISVTDVQTCDFQCAMLALEPEMNSTCMFSVYIQDSSECLLGSFGSALAQAGNRTELVLQGRVILDVVKNWLSMDWKFYDVYTSRFSEFIFSHRNYSNPYMCLAYCLMDHRCHFTILVSGFKCFFGDFFTIPEEILSIGAVNENVELFAYIKNLRSVEHGLTSQAYIPVIISESYLFANTLTVYTDSQATLDLCASICHLYKWDYSKGCQFFAFLPLSNQCHLGTMSTTQKDQTQSNSTIVVHFRKVLALKYLTLEFTKEVWSGATWSKHMYRNVTLSGTLGEEATLQCLTHCLLDTSGPCDIFVIIDLVCYLGAWNVNASLFSFSTDASVYHRTRLLGTMAGGYIESSGSVFNKLESIFGDGKHCGYNGIENLPLSVFGHGMTFYSKNNKIYSCGGLADVTTTNYEKSCFAYDMKSLQDGWIQEGSLPVGLAFFVMIEHEGNLFTIGGKMVDGTANSVVYAYDELNKKWLTESSQLETAVFHHCAVVYGKSIYIVSGSNGTHDIDGWTVWNKGKGTWTVNGPLINGGRIGHACGVLSDPDSGNDVLVVAGGYSHDLGMYLNTVEYLDLQNGTIWQSWPQLFDPWGQFGSSANSIMVFDFETASIALGYSVKYFESSTLWVNWNVDEQRWGTNSERLYQGRAWAGYSMIPLHLTWVCSVTQVDWVLLVFHDVNSGFFVKDGWDTGSIGLSPFSNLSSVEQYRSCHGSFHFRLVWPSLGDYNEWMQESSPLKPFPTSGYQPIAVKYNLHFEGLYASNTDLSQTLLMGDTQSNGYSYAVGRFSATDNLLPGPAFDDGATKTTWLVNQVYLYVHKDC